MSRRRRAEKNKDQNALQAENDELRQQLAAGKNEQIGNFRKLYEEMNKADKADENKN